MKPSPRHSKCGRSAKTSPMISERPQVALVRDDARVLVLDLAATLGELAQHHQHRLQEVERLEAGDRDRLAVLVGDELERARADDGRDVAGADEAVEAQVGRLQQRAQRRDDRDVGAHARRSSRRSRPWRGAASARSRARWSRSRSRRTRPRARGSAWRCAARRAASRPCARRRPAALASSRRLLGARHAQHVAEAGEDHARLVRERDAVVDAAHRDHADRAAGTVDELDVGGQQVVDAVLVDRVRVPAADLHDLVVAAGLDRGEDLAGEPRGRARRRGTRRRTSRRRLDGETHVRGPRARAHRTRAHALGRGLVRLGRGLIRLGRGLIRLGRGLIERRARGRCRRGRAATRPAPPARRARSRRWSVSRRRRGRARAHARRRPRGPAWGSPRRRR